MSLARTLWAENNALAIDSLENPFVQGILSGNLKPKNFAYYVSQDAFFLKAFARAYVIAGAKARDWDDFVQLHGLAQGVLDEMKLHEKYAQELGIDLVNVTPATATQRYTDFVMATAWGSDAGLIVTTLTPCMRLYAWLGKTLAAQQTKEHVYSDWITTYASQEIEDLACELEALVDKYANPQDPQVAAAYRYAMVCELDFFQAAFDFKG